MILGAAIITGSPSLFGWGMSCGGRQYHLQDVIGSGRLTKVWLPGNDNKAAWMAPSNAPARPPEEHGDNGQF